MKQKIRIGHSPDADDAFMFYALAKGKIPLDGFEIEQVLEEIDCLNQRALQRGAYRHTPLLEVTALSCHAYGFLSDRYQLLPYGASVGEGYGPILVAPSHVLAPATPLGGSDTSFGGSPQHFQPKVLGPRNDGRVDIRGRRIAVPGRYTTAYLVLQFYEADFQPLFTPFDQIFTTLERGEADFGLLIHEGQLTYRELGFQKVLDLGEWWGDEYQLPLPLGLNAIRRDLANESQTRFAELFRKSLEYAFAHREEAMQYALEFGRGIDAERGDEFVGKYVNPYSLELGERGKKALQLLFDLGWKKGLFPLPVKIEDLV